MFVVTAGCTWLEDAEHDFVFVVHEVAGIEFSLATLEVHDFLFFYFFEVYYHINVVLWAVNADVQLILMQR
jgi:hypothetical protein